jgi:hypothetical protein
MRKIIEEVVIFDAFTCKRRAVKKGIGNNNYLDGEPGIGIHAHTN